MFQNTVKHLFIWLYDSVLDFYLSSFLLQPIFLQNTMEMSVWELKFILYFAHLPK